jgi:hypothetical protein
MSYMVCVQKVRDLKILYACVPVHARIIAKQMVNIYVSRKRHI